MIIRSVQSSQDLNKLLDVLALEIVDASYEFRLYRELQGSIR
jgi:hypothetical protein